MPLSVAVIDMDWHRVDIDPRVRQRLDRLHLEHRPLPRPGGVPRRAARARARDVAQRAPGRGRARARGRRTRAIAEAPGRRPGDRAAGALRPDRPRLPRGLLRGAAPPARGRGRRLLVARLAAGRRHPDARARPAVAAQPLPLPRLRARRPAAADVLALRRHRQPPLPDRLLRRHRTSPGSRWTSSPTSPRRPPTSATAGGATTSAATSRATATTSWRPAGCSSASSRRSTGCTRDSTRSTPRSRGGSARGAETVMTRVPAAAPPAAALPRHDERPRATRASRSSQPMYYDHPDEPAAYTCPNQFMFGTELLVAPITSPADRGDRARPGQGLAARGRRGSTCSPASRYRGGRTLHLHRDLGSIPVLARAGGDRADGAGRRAR